MLPATREDSEATVSFSEARPSTARPTTARPTTRGGPQTTSQDSHGQWSEDDDDDDGVFAFAPPGTSSGPTQLVYNVTWQANDHSQLHQAAVNSHRDTRNGDTHESSLYYDEAYGAVYDQDGRMIKPPVEKPANIQTSGLQQSRSKVQNHVSADVTESEASHWSPTSTLQEDIAVCNRFRDTKTVSEHSLASNFSAGKKPLCGPSASCSTTNPALSAPNELDETDLQYQQAIKKVRSSEDPRLGNGFSPHQQVQRNWEAGQHFGMLRMPSDAVPFIAEQAETPKYEGQGWDSAELLNSLSASKGMRTVQLELEEEDDSPYPEVRASVSNVDDPSMPALTFRSLFLGLGLNALLSATNTFFQMRSIPMSIAAIVVQILVHPIGKMMAATLPFRTFYVPKWLGGFGFSFNPGLWNIKEHTVVTIATTTGVSPAYAITLLLAQESPHYWNMQHPLIYGSLLVSAPQLIALSFAGFSRRFLTRPASMIWPLNLATTTILNTLHAEEESLDGSMSRLKCFVIVSAGAFCFFFIPGYLFQALSYLNWVCWIWPDNVPINTVFGVASGMGVSVLTLDWTQISFLSNPLITPWWAQVNIFSGFAIGFWIAAPALYFSNTWYTAHFPMISGTSYDRHGQPYNVNSITSDRNSLNVDAYMAYSPVYIPASLIVTYCASFALLAAAIVHTGLHHGKLIWNGLTLAKTEEDDIHAKLMLKYFDVPDRWFAGLFVVAFGLATVFVTCFSTGVPFWGLVISLLIPALYMLPFGFIYAMSGLPLTVNLLSELAASYLLPSRPVAMMICKTLSQQTMLGALMFSQDQKLGHYMKVPPRVVFFVQICSILMCAVVQVATKSWMLNHIPNMCSPDQPNHFTCPSVNIFYTASIVWGVIGPKRSFGPGSLYNPVYYGLLVGAITPLLTWYLSQKLPRTKIRFLSTPLVFAGMTFCPPMSGINFTSWIATGFLFQSLLRRKNFAWWTKYNFVTAGALDFGSTLASLVIYMALQLPKNGALSLNWWGNTVFTNTADYQGTPFLEPPSQGFGPAPVGGK